MSRTTAVRAPGARPLPMASSAVGARLGRIETDRAGPGRGSGSRSRRNGPARALAPPVVHDVIRSAGRPLDPDIRAFMQRSFGRDLSGVRVHADPKAARSAAAVGAEAYTVGQDIVFGTGGYRPETAGGGRLLAHELSHVRPLSTPPARDALEIEPPGSVAERRAERQAERVFRGEAMGPGASASSAPGRLLRSALLGVGIGGAVLGAVVGGLLGGALGALAGGLIGLVAGLAIGALIDAARRGREDGEEETTGDPHFHWATREEALLLGEPDGDETTAIGALPPGTRVAIMERGTGDHARVRVTTGPSLGVEGWVRRSALERRRNTAQVTPEVAVRLFDELAAARFLTTEGEEAPIPFHYPPDGCYARADRMADLLIEKGYEPRKVFAVSRVRTSTGWARPGLRVPTEFAPDVPAGQEPAVEWWYHVAPIIKVRGPTGDPVDMVIDPSMFDRPVTVEEWTGGMSGERFENLSLRELRALLSEHGDYPVDRPITFVTGTEVYSPPRPGASGATPDPAGTSRAVMTQYAREARTHELAAELRRELRRDSPDAERILRAIRAAPADSRREIRDGWPGLMALLRDRLGPHDQGRVLDAFDEP